MVVVKDFYYEKAQHIFVQGNKETVDRYIEDGFTVASGGNGSVNMYKPTVAGFQFEVDNDGVDRRQSVKHLIREYYNVERVSKKRTETFFNACKSNQVCLNYSTERGLYL